MNEELFLKSRFRNFIGEFVEHSKSLKRGKFTRDAIAQLIFPNSDPAYAKSHFSACYRDNSARELDAGTLLTALDVSRSLLLKQLQALDRPAPESELAEFEKSVCRSLKFGGTRATLDDFRIDRCHAEAISAEDFGVPDILAWGDQTFGFYRELAAIQERSVRSLRELVHRIAREDDDRRRIKLLQVACSIASLNHPGTRWHETAFNLALTAASQANLLLLTKGYRIAEELRQPATYLNVHLNWARFIPTLDSPTNYFRYAIQGKPMPSHVWREIRPFLEESVAAATFYAEMLPNDAHAVELRSSALSMKARFLAVSGQAGALREADKLQKESLRDLERFSLPYGFAYPVLKDIVQSKFKAAIRRCQEAVAVCQRSDAGVSAAAFGALQFHLTSLCGKGATRDAEVRRLAADSLASTAARYKCSHIFDAQAVEALLAAPRR